MLSTYLGFLRGEWNPADPKLVVDDYHVYNQ